MIRAILIVWCCLAAVVSARDFDPRRDGFAFANETVFAYGVDEAGHLHMDTRAQPVKFAHGCMLMTRATMQFWKFARFDPQQPRLDREEYRARLRRLFRIPVWFGARAQTKRIVFPGHADLWSFSHACQGLIQEEIGHWFPTYLRVGNWRMAFPFIRWLQGPIARATARAVQREPQTLYLAKFPSMNHAVIAYSAETHPDGGIRFQVYDPNYPGQTARLDYVAKQNLFDFEPRFYWPGGLLRAFRIYLSPIH